MHQAKGHDWDYVLVLHAVEGSWPFFRATTKAVIEEELHSLYVAVTRAAKGVFLFEGRYKNAKARKEFAQPSSFLDDQRVRRPIKIVSASDAIAHPCGVRGNLTRVRSANCGTGNAERGFGTSYRVRRNRLRQRSSHAPAGPKR